MQAARSAGADIRSRPTSSWARAHTSHRHSEYTDLCKRPDPRGAATPALRFFTVANGSASAPLQCHHIRCDECEEDGARGDDHDVEQLVVAEHRGPEPWTAAGIHEGSDRIEDAPGEHVDQALQAKPHHE